MASTQNAACPLIRGPAKQLSTSLPLDWDGIVVERHIAAVGERIETPAHRYILEMSAGKALGRGESPNILGRYRPYIKKPGSLSFFCDGRLPALRSFTELDLIACALDPPLIAGIAEEQERGTSLRLPTRLGVQDTAVAALLRCLEDEAQSGGLTGRLYADHLAHSLVLRLFALDGKTLDVQPRRASSSAYLNRVLERMDAEFDKDLDLKTLAAETGYSRNHFLSLFRQHTGTSPHQHLLRLRISKAKNMLRLQGRKLIDIALASGFPSPNQFSRAFRRSEGLSPSEYRKQIR